MKKLSSWAKTHKWPARIIIVTGFILLILLGIITGQLLRDLLVDLPRAVLFLFIGIYLACALLYPVKKPGAFGGVKQRSYRRQKTCDLLLAGSTFLMVVFLSNKQTLFPGSTSMAAPVTATLSTLPGDSATRSYKPIKEFSASMKDGNGKMLRWKERKKMLKEQIRAIKHSNEPSPGGKTALIVLSILIALGLIALLAALSCNISCSGSAGLAILVMVLGTGLVIFLLIRIVQRLTGKRKKEIKNPETGQPGT
jgi:hypothetical protein